MVPERLIRALADRYRIERELGAGGMATVYLADDLRHERKVAVKVLRPELAATIGPERFLREIRIAAQLQHPHILPLLESGEADGYLYYVMPYVDGQSLRDRLARQGELPVPEAVRLMTEIVDALSYAHGRGVVHRDVKPDNVMLSGRHALVMDFGVAKAVSEASGRNQLTTAGVALGSPAYMAPEQAAADPHLDHRVDIYAVGVMAYELLAGRPPFVGGSPQQVLAAHVTQAPEALSKFRPGISPGLEQAVMRCLAKRPADRWQSAEELMNQLEPLVTPSAGMTPTTTRPIEGYQRGRRRRWLIAGAALIGALALGTTWALMGNRTPPRRPPVRLDRTQLTFTGNAYSPAISEDGKSVAYVTKECDGRGRCTENLVVQDVGGAGSAVILKGILTLWTLEWSGDGRFLVLSASFGAERWGAFSVSALGGEPRYLGCCEGNLIGASDTALVHRDALVGDSTATLRWVTISDGVVHDSVRIPQSQGEGLYAEGLPDGRHVVVEHSTPAGSRIVILDRKGNPVDSVVVAAPQRLGGISPGGNSLTIMAPRQRSSDYDFLAYWINNDGTIEDQPDTVIQQLSVNTAIDASSDGRMVYGFGPTDYSVLALSRDSPTSMRFRERRLAAGTATTTGTLSPDGLRVLLWRDVLVGDRLLVQLSVMPFDSGPETPIGPPRDFLDKDWSQDGRHVVAGVKLGADSVALLEFDVGSERSRILATYSRVQYRWIETLPGGGYVLLLAGRQIRVVGSSVRPDTTYQIPGAMGGISSFDPSPDGRALVVLGWDRNADSIVANQVSLVDGSIERLAVFAGEDTQPPRWLLDGSMILPISETGATLAWYRIPPGGGRPVRLGSAPRYSAEYRFSADGRHVVMGSSERRSDVYLVRNYGEAFQR